MAHLMEYQIIPFNSTVNDQDIQCETKKKYRTMFNLEEDLLIRSFVEEYGDNNWDDISLYIPSRSGRQCRERWYNYLFPNINQSNWSLEEDRVLFQVYNQIGPKWGDMVHYFNNRSRNNIKNRWNTIIRKGRMKSIDCSKESMFLEIGRQIEPRMKRYHNDDEYDKKTTKSYTQSKCIEDIDPFSYFKLSHLLNHKKKRKKEENNEKY